MTKGVGLALYVVPLLYVRASEWYKKFRGRKISGVWQDPRITHPTCFSRSRVWYQMAFVRAPSLRWATRKTRVVQSLACRLANNIDYIVGVFSFSYTIFNSILLLYTHLVWKLSNSSCCSLIDASRSR